MVEAPIEDLAITTLFGGGTASLRPATKGAYPLGTPNSVSPDAVVLRGNLPQLDGDVVSSTTLLKD
jgi:hypothetical protein